MIVGVVSLIIVFVICPISSLLSVYSADMRLRRTCRSPIFSTATSKEVLDVSSTPEGSRKRKPTLTKEDRTRALLETQAGAIIALETNFMVSNVDDDAAIEKSVKKKAGRKVSQSKKAPILSPREATGFNFTGIDKDTGDKFEYDVPFLDVAKWYTPVVISKALHLIVLPPAGIAY